MSGGTSGSIPLTFLINPNFKRKVSDMYAALALKMKTAAEGAKLPASPTALIVWGFSLSEILKVLLDEALELGREYRNELEQSAKTAVDAVVAFDLPVIPEGVENTLDEATRAAGYAAIVAVLDAILGPVDAS